jgi:hypothetical protein
MTMIKAFGREVNRADAYEVIFHDWLHCIFHAWCADDLKGLWFDGWKALPEWTDQELEDYIDTLCAGNQPDTLGSDSERRAMAAHSSYVLETTCRRSRIDGASTDD